MHIRKKWSQKSVLRTKMVPLRSCFGSSFFSECLHYSVSHLCLLACTCVINYNETSRYRDATYKFMWYGNANKDNMLDTKSVHANLKMEITHICITSCCSAKERKLQVKLGSGYMYLKGIWHLISECNFIAYTVRSSTKEQSLKVWSYDRIFFKFSGYTPGVSSSRSVPKT